LAPIELAENYADGRCVAELLARELENVREIMVKLAQQRRALLREGTAEAANQCQLLWAAWNTIPSILDPTSVDWISLTSAAIQSALATSGRIDLPWDGDRHLCDLLRDIFVYRFRAHTIAIDADWLIWRDGTVVKLAQTIYSDRRFDIMPILGDALHEAGCCDEAILDHCRGPNNHVRGCWVVDLLLGKQ
jgi:hypothetical protein